MGRYTIKLYVISQIFRVQVFILETSFFTPAENILNDCFNNALNVLKCLKIMQQIIHTRLLSMRVFIFFSSSKEIDFFLVFFNHECPVNYVNFF